MKTPYTLLFSLLQLSLFALAASQTFLHYDLDSFNANVTDSSGNGHYGNLTGDGASLISGRFGNATAFDQSKGLSQIAIQGGNLLNSTFSVSFWMQVQYQLDVHEKVFSSKGNSSLEEGFQIEFHPKDNTFTFFSSDNSTASWSNVPVKYNDWFNAVFVINQTSCDFYFNGYWAGSQVVGEVSASSSSLLIGSDGTIQNSFSGYLDEVYLFEYPLVSSQVLQLQENEEPTNGNETVANSTIYFPLTSLYYDFEDGNLTSFSDESGSGRDGVAIGNGISRISGAVGNAIYFDQSVGFTSIQVENSNQFVEKFTVSSFAYIRFAVQTYQILFSTKQDLEDATGFQIQFYPPSKEIRFYSSGFSYVSWSDLDVTFNSWFHVAVRVNANNVELFIGGESQGSKTISPIVQGLRSLYIGGNDNFNGFSGGLDEIYVFQGEVSNEQIAQLANE